MSRTGFDRRDLLALAAGGVLGAALRWLISGSGDTAAEGGWFVYEPSSAAAFDGPGFPWRTLAANVLGCLVLGAVVALRSRHLGHRRLVLAAGTGFCGSLTTFSTFAVEIAAFMRGPAAPRSASGVDITIDGPSSPGRAVAYLTLSIVSGALALLAGRALARSWPGGPP